MNLYSVNINENFLEQLINGIFQKFKNDPLIIAEMKIFLPTKRSCRLFDQIFLSKAEGKFAIIPKTYPINDINYLDIIGLISATDIKLYPEKKVNDISVLSYLVYKLDEKKKTSAKIKNIPSYSLAQKILSILKELAENEISVEKLDEILQYQDYEFLHFLCDFIKELSYDLNEFLDKKNIITSYQRQNLIYDLLADFWHTQSSQYPIIFAGITSFHLKLKKLLKIVSSLENGYVILNKISDNEKVLNTTNINHPISPIKQISDFLGVSLNNMKNWCEWKGQKASDIFIDAVFWPVELTAEWRNIANEKIDISSINIINCEYEIEEAKSVVLICKKHLLENNYKIAVIVKEFSMKRRLYNEFKRHGIIVNDTIGKSLGDTSLCSLFSLILEYAKDRNDAHLLLAILKNAKCNIVNNRKLHQELTERLELEILRGILPQKLKDISHLLEGELLDFFKKINKAFSVLDNDKMFFKDWLAAHIQILCLLTSIADILEICVSDEDYVFYKFLQDLALVDNSIKIHRNLYMSMLRSIIQNYSCKESLSEHHNIHLVAPEEARMFNADVNIITSFNNDTWSGVELDQWFNQDIREKLSFVSTNYYSALNFLDILQFLYSKHVYLTWSVYTTAGMKIESSILTKIKMLSEYLNVKDQMISKHVWQDYAKLFDRSAESTSYDDTMPKIALADKPKKLSITQFERLVNNPYSIYAQLVLKLHPLDDINKNPMLAEFGTFIHDCLYDYSLLPEKNMEQFNIVVKNNLKKYVGYHLYYIWLTKATNIAEWVESFYKQLFSNFVVFAEEKGSLEIIVGKNIFKITGKADLIAIEKNKSGSLILDFKTGILPTITEIKKFSAIQLLIESLILSKSGFKNINIQISEEFYYDLQYLKVSFSDKNPEIVKFYISDNSNEISDIEEKIYEFLKQYFADDYEFKKNDNVLSQYDNYLHFSRYEENT